MSTEEPEEPQPIPEAPKPSPPNVNRAPDLKISTPSKPAAPRRTRATLPPVDHGEFDDHEEVHGYADPESGLRAIIAIHSTALGPGIGGCRMKEYVSSAAALADVLRLSKGMSYKCAMIDLPMGGAKSVIIAAPGSAEKPKLLAAFAERVEQLSGRYWTAEDANISPEDVEVMAAHTQYVTGRRAGPAPGGAPEPVTARGVVLGIEACFTRVFGAPDPNGKRVSILGAGNVGGRIAALLAQAGADVAIADLDESKAERVAQQVGARCLSVDALWATETDLFCPCALGASVTETRAESLKARIVAGAENNQLATPAAGDRLHERGILYGPDYVLNAGGLINCYAEIVAVQKGVAFDTAWVDGKLKAISDNLNAIFALADKDGKATHVVADAEARRRIGRG
jgi:leucine dehydrogenase